MEVKRRILVVGLGSIGRRHARLLRERGDLAVEGCEPDPQARERAMQELPGFRIHESYAQALRESPDMVVVATPHHFHGDHAVAAMEAGAHVLCEKPISDRVEEGLRMKAAAERTGRVLAVGFQMHFHPGAQRLKALIEEGRLGRILHAHCHVGSYITLVNSISRHQAKVEGALLMDYTHQPDLLYWLLRRRPTHVFMAGAQGGDMELTSRPNFLTLTCEYDEPMISTVNLNYLQMPERHHYEIAGDRAWVTWNLNTGELCIGVRQAQAIEREQISTERDPIYRAEHAAFLAAVAGERPPESPPTDALVSLVLISGAMESWRTGRRVALAWPS